ncbi:alpha/beta hydrolase [Roseibacterium sp. SDUM158017]|uniref:alpha/beta fold hydrolase n=1 Tax=Roseicyclus salinarum TaxID=3036773 RepID=UPI00241577C5|nr:alpha/beta hydrolase [Roseibacterium sp. SDUM158017]MDG4649394.1 alpha/beta hydrolase [Roseibacterium sp. SDUM158017]
MTMTASDGTEISYLAAGRGPAVFLLHGFASAAMSWWTIGAAQRLARRGRVIAPDIRGHGESDKPTDASFYGNRLLADLAELLDHEGEDTVDVAGFSMGAEIGLAFAVRYPHRVLSLTLAGSGWSPEGIVAEYRKWFEILAPASDTPDALAALIEGVPDLTGLSEEDVAGIDVPLHGIIGEHDDERRWMERIAEARPNFTPHVLPGVDHMGTWRSPDFPGLLAGVVTGDE